MEVINMRYQVSQRFYDLANILVEVALQGGNEIEYDIAVGFLQDLITEGDK